MDCGQEKELTSPKQTPAHAMGLTAHTKTTYFELLARNQTSVYFDFGSENQI